MLPINPPVQPALSEIGDQGSDQGSRAGPASLRLRLGCCRLSGAPVMYCANTAYSKGCGGQSKINWRNFWAAAVSRDAPGQDASANSELSLDSRGVCDEPDEASSECEQPTGEISGRAAQPNPSHCPARLGQFGRCNRMAQSSACRVARRHSIVNARIGSWRTDG